MWSRRVKAYSVALFLCFVQLCCAGDRFQNVNQNKQFVCIRDGCLQGKSERGNFIRYDAWYGIPFAAPPVGELRFKVK